MQQRITFPYVGEVKGSKVWRNAETGVEIIKGKNFREVGLYYVAVRTLGADGRVVVAARRTLAGAREDATFSAELYREQIAKAYAEAQESARLYAEGDAIREANAREQIEEWWARHDLVTPDSYALIGDRILAAIADDHLAAIAENLDRLVEDDAMRGAPSRVDNRNAQMAAWLRRRGVGLTPTPGTVARGVELDHAEALVMNRVDNRGMHMGPGHVAPATIERAWTAALAEDSARKAGHAEALAPAIPACSNCGMPRGTNAGPCDECTTLVPALTAPAGSVSIVYIDGDAWSINSLAATGQIVLVSPAAAWHIEGRPLGGYTLVNRITGAREYFAEMPAAAARARDSEPREFAAPNEVIN